MSRIDESGFTLVEAIVAMVLMVLVGGLVVSVYLFGVRSVSSWQSGIDLTNTAHTVHQRLIAELRAAEHVDVSTDSLTIRFSSEGAANKYPVRDSTLFRNDMDMLGTELSVLEFSPSITEIELDTLGNTRQSIRIEYAIASRRDTLRRSINTTLRSPHSWATNSDE